MSQRVHMLQKLVGQGSPDPFHRYALALEYRRERRLDEAIATFEALRQARPDYLPMYLMAGQLLLELDRVAVARTWLEQGLELARRQGDTKTAGEIEDALAATGPASA